MNFTLWTKHYYIGIKYSPIPVWPIQGQHNDIPGNVVQTIVYGYLSNSGDIYLFISITLSKLYLID